jgi:hypothetical protein
MTGLFCAPGTVLLIHGMSDTVSISTFSSVSGAYEALSEALNPGGKLVPKFGYDIAAA